MKKNRLWTFENQFKKNFYEKIIWDTWTHSTLGKLYSRRYFEKSQKHTYIDLLNPTFI